MTDRMPGQREFSMLVRGLRGDDDELAAAFMVNRQVFDEVGKAIIEERERFDSLSADIDEDCIYNTRMRFYSIDSAFQRVAESMNAMLGAQEVPLCAASLSTDDDSNYRYEDGKGRSKIPFKYSKITGLALYATHQAIHVQMTRHSKSPHALAHFNSAVARLGHATTAGWELFDLYGAAGNAPAAYYASRQRLCTLSAAYLWLRDEGNFFPRVPRVALAANAVEEYDPEGGLGPQELGSTIFLMWKRTGEQDLHAKLVQRTALEVVR